MDRSGVAILGYGRFGSALADLVEEAGLPVRALDIRLTVPESRRVDDIPHLLADARFVFLATPLGAFEAALRSLRPHLQSSHIVIDVASVKEAPVAEMTRALGDEVPWVASHPLFGPSSIALGERPLRVVVCPNPLQAASTDAVRCLYETIGCEVMVQDASTHDRVMAQTHALAFFVAKGLLDMGTGDKLPFAPPSFQAMARTIEAVRSDAGHLFLTIQRDNGYSSEARRAFLEALGSAHHQIEAWGEKPAGDAGALDIPNLGGQAPESRAPGELLEECDRELIRLIARRAQIARRADRVGEVSGEVPRDPAGERALLDRRRSWAAQHDLEEEAVAQVFAAVLRSSDASPPG